VNYLTQELTHYKNAEVGAGWDALRYLRGVSEGEVVRFPITQAEPLRLELQSFLRAVKDGGKVEVDGAAGLQALRLALTLMTSASEARMIGRDELRALAAGNPLSS
jgi:predicted dehydrogenase